MQSSTLVTDHISWRFNESNLTALPRAKKNPDNYSCICCAMADHFQRCTEVWLRGVRGAAENITIDIVVADHEDAQYIEDIKSDLGREFFQASVFVLENNTHTWTSLGVLITDKQRFSDHTIFLAESGRNAVSSSHLEIDIKSFDSHGNAGEPGSLYNVLGEFVDTFGIFNGILMIKDAQ